MRFSCLVALVCVLFAGGAQAASPMIQAYKAYLAALDQGDVVTADQEGEKAWKAAEEANNKKYSAILAYNLAELRLRYLPHTDVKTPAKRSYELTKQADNPGLAVQSAQLIMALSAFMDKPNKNTRRSLKWAIKAFDAAQLEPSYPMFRSHFELMKEASYNQDWRTTRDEAKAALGAYQDLQMNEPTALASVKLFDASAVLIQSDFKEIREAEEDLQAIFDALGPQRYDRPNKLFLAAWAWGQAAKAMQYSRHTSKGRILDTSLPPETGRPETCQPINWIKKEKPKYPPKMLKKGYVGAAIVQYSLGQDGVPKEVNLVAEVPMTKFGNYAADAVREWRATPMPGVPSACRDYIKANFIFMLKK